MAYPTGLEEMQADDESAHPGYVCRWGETIANVGLKIDSSGIKGPVAGVRQSWAIAVVADCSASVLLVNFQM
jgi:hypothetical protein